MTFRNRSLIGALLGLFVLTVFLRMHENMNTFSSILDASSRSGKSQDPVIPFTTHIVLFRFTDNATPGILKDITLHILGLQKSCIHPKTQKPYIESITGGKDNSPEGLQEGLSHAFVVRFQSNEDRDYYANEDPAHQAFKKAAGPYIEKAVVVDFQNGNFMRTG